MRPNLNQSAELRDYGRILWRHRRVILLIFLATSFAAAAVSLLMTPVYKATTTIAISQKSPQVNFPSGLSPISAVLGGGLRMRAVVETEAELLASRELAKSVFDALCLVVPRHKVDRNLRPYLYFWAVDSHLPEGRYTIRFTGTGGCFDLLHEEDGLIGSGQIGRVFEEGGFTFLLAMPADQIQDGTFTLEKYPKALEQFQKKIKVDLIKNSDVISITVALNDRGDCARAANLLVHNYFKLRKRWIAGESGMLKQLFQKRAEETRGRLAQAEERLKAFQQAHGAIALEREAQERVARLVQLEAARAEVQIERDEITLRAQQSAAGMHYARITKAPTRLTQANQGNQAGGRKVDPTATLGRGALTTFVLNDMSVQQLKTDLARLEVERAALREKYTPRHPKMIGIESQIRQITTELAQAREDLVGAEQAALDQREMGLTRLIGGHEKELADLPDKALTYARLLREVELQNEIYTVLLTKQEEARVAEAVAIGDRWVLDRAVPPYRRSSPKRALNTLAGGLLGLILGVWLAFYRAGQDRSLRTISEIQAHLGLPVMGSMAAPVAAQINGQRPSRPLYPKAASETVASSPSSPETVDGALPASDQALAVNLLTAARAEGHKVWLLAAVDPPGRGSTAEVIRGLGERLGGWGERTLLVDLDFARPRLHQLFGLASDAGVMNILSEQIDPASLIQPALQGRVDVLPLGKAQSDIRPTLLAQQLPPMLNWMRAHYGLVLLAGPPVLEEAVTPLLAVSADGVLLAVRSGGTSIDEAVRARHLLEKAGATVSGVVLTDIPLAETQDSDYFLFPYANGILRRARTWVK